ncbi:hypothetical protein SpAn4DRAFT_4244 [Sporomusa ovata]|uniref:Uncharacterized protein n=1 Tax=Sporomusa ovata TaxID=2378 RepID=A0A0U1L5D2_9FIRM|nr:hypothetical protein SpAn4DRAFT_1798 [Sporomusa ovata]CQR74887.1 hypothetical protein SpAn4DRAFT_4244 [Sporomusa ovata]
MPILHHATTIQILNSDMRWLGFRYLINYFIGVIITDIS